MKSGIQFNSRSSLIDQRDIDDYKILENLKSNKNNNLYYLNKKIINIKLNVILVTNK